MLYLHPRRTERDPRMTVYIVSGDRRSGSSLMMAALVAGGMEAHYDPDHTRRLAESVEIRRKVGAAFEAAGRDVMCYEPLAMGHFEIYEPASEEIRQMDFPREHDGKVIKIKWGGLPNLAVMKSGYRYIIMLRDPAEIVAELGGDEGREFLRSKEAYHGHFMQVQNLLLNRSDTRTVTRMRFREELIANPEHEFARLRSLGWPITDPFAALAAVEAGLVHLPEAV